MEFLTKLQSLSFKCFICIWILDWFARIGRECAFGWRFHSAGLPWDYDLHSSGSYALFGALSILLGWKYLRRRTAECSSGFHSHLMHHIERLYPIVLVPKAFGLGFTSAVFIYFSCFFIYCSMDGLTKVAACVADYSTNYELAERIIRMDISREPGKSFTTWQTHFRPENETVRNARNLAVAEVYGTDSLQMADREKFIGENILITSHYAPSRLMEASTWLKHSLKIDIMLGANERGIDTLNQLALISHDQNDHAELTKILSQASELLDTPSKFTASTRDRKDYSCSLAFLSDFAKKAGDQRLAHRFMSKCFEVKPQREDSSDYLRALLCFSVIILILALNVLPIHVPMLERLILSNRYDLSKQRFMQSGTLATSMEALSAMITIDLYRGKLRQSWENGILALKLSGIETQEKSQCFVERRMSFPLPMVLESAHATLFVALFFSTFFF
jgi:hypothetical protein